MLSEILTRHDRTSDSPALDLVILRNRFRLVDSIKNRERLRPSLEVIPEETVDADGVMGFESCLYTDELMIDLWRHKLPVRAPSARMNRHQNMWTWIGMGSFGIKEPCNEDQVDRDK
jgi:hypothetical protein